MTYDVEGFLIFFTLPSQPYWGCGGEKAAVIRENQEQLLIRADLLGCWWVAECKLGPSEKYTVVMAGTSQSCESKAHI